MDYRDLAFGDWIQVERGYDRHLTNERVKGVIGDEDRPYPVRLFTEETVSLNDIHPIPLTEDILEKNGFRIQVTDDNSKWLWVTDNSWLAYSERHNYWYYEDMKIIYVHQLQHFLHLCSVEKELVMD